MFEFVLVDVELLGGDAAAFAHGDASPSTVVDGNRTQP